MYKDSLSKLAIKYGTDRATKHSYTPYYHNMFYYQRNEVRKMLEIGVGEGAGLRMWRDFFPNAKIYGADNETNRVFEEDRIKVFLCDQSKSDDLTRLITQTGTDLNIIIDDGSHKPEDQINTFLSLRNFLRDDLVYIIEDVAHPEITSQIPKEFEWEVIEFTKRYDDRLIKIKKAHG